MTLHARQQGLHLLCVSTAIGVAGCLEGDAGTPTRLVELSGVNYTSEPRVLTVEIRIDGETQYTESIELDGTPEGEGGFDASSFDGYPTAPDSYVVHGWHDDQTRADAMTFEFTNVDQECVAIIVQIGASPHLEDIGSDIRFMHSTGCPETG